MTLGNSSVEKTNFIIRYTENTFSEVYLTTIGFYYKTKIVKLSNDKTYKLDFLIQLDKKNINLYQLM